MTSPEAPHPPRPGMGEKEFVVLMALLQALQALAIDIMLPALGVIATDLGESDPNRRQLVVAVFLICAGLGSLFPGALADRYGRRPVLFTSLSAYVALSFGAALVRDFTTLLVLRGMAGFAASGLLVMSGAIIRDRFEGDKMARTQSLVSMVFMIVPMAAPTLGQAVVMVAGWRAVFVVMALLGAGVWLWAWLRLPETLRPQYRQQVNLRAILGNMRFALSSRAAFGYVFGMALIQAALFGYINSSQQLIAEHFGAGTAFPLIFGAMALVMSGAAFTNSRIVVRFGARRVSHTAVFVYIAAAIGQLVLAQSGVQSLLGFALLMTLSMVMVAFIGGNFQSIALQPFAHIAGAAASLQAFIRMLIAAILGALIGQAYDGTARPLALALLVAGLSTLALVLFSERGRLFRRLNRPSQPPIVPV